MHTPQSISVPCPLCGRRFAAQVQTIIDVGQDPDAKFQLLRGQINVGTCPQCGNAGILNAPFVYHDPDKELLLCFLPPGLNLRDDEQHKLVGGMTNRVINYLRPEERKGYLLQPRIFFSLQGLMDEVVRAEGVTQEMLEARKVKLDLLRRFLDATSDDVLRVLARENDAQLDYEFFSILTRSIEMAKAEGEEDNARRLLGLREKLLKFSSLGRASQVEREVIEALEQGMTRDEFLAKVIKCESDAELETVIALGRHMLDYQFFRSLTSKIEAHEGEENVEEAQRLKRLRSRILEIRDKLDAETQAILRKKADLLKGIFKREDLEEALREHMQEIDSAFFTVLSASIEQAETEGDKEAVRRLKRLETLVFGLLEEITPRPIKLINQLMEAQYPERQRSFWRRTLSR